MKSDCTVQGDQALTAANLGRSSRRIALRDAKIVAARARGKSWPTIAREHKLSIRRCHQIVDEWRSDGLGADVIDPSAEIRAMLDLLGQAIEDLAAVEERTKHDGWKIAATRQKVDVALTRLDLLQALGVMPSPQTMRFEHEVQQLFRDFADLGRQFDVPEGYLQALVELSERNLGRTPALALEAA